MCVGEPMIEQKEAFVVHRALQPFTQGVRFSGSLREDVIVFLSHHGCAKTAAHSRDVADEAIRLASRYAQDLHAAECAALLHDISAVIPVGERVAVAEQLELDILPEERAVPMIIHQKLSVVIARDIFGVDSPSILSAIECHTTLKADASLLDKIIFLADKLQRNAGRPPYKDALATALVQSLDAGVWCYLDYLWQQQAQLSVVHPWLVQAYHQMSRQFQHDG